MRIIVIILCHVLCAIGVNAQNITTIAGNGSLGNSGDGGPATIATMRVLAAVLPDGNGNLYISDALGNRIRKVDASGIITTFAGSGPAGPSSFSGDGGAATDAKLYDPNFIAQDKKGNLYVADCANYRVRKISTSGIITTVAGNGTTTYLADGVAATATGMNGCAGICFDAIGNLYIGEKYRIFKVDTYGVITTYAGTGIVGYSGDGGPATSAKLGLTGQIVMDALGNMFVGCQSSNNAVRKISPLGIIKSFAGNGIDGFSGDGGPATAAQLNAPGGVYPDKCGNVYLSEFYNNRIRMVDGHGMIRTIAGTGVAGYSGDGGAAIVAALNKPNGVYIYNNSIYIADGGNYAVRYIHMDTCKNVVDIPPLIANVELTLIPNPNQGTFRLHLSSAIDEQAVVVVTDMVGVKVKEITVLTNKETEIILDVPRGVYLLSVMTSEGRHVERIVVE